MTQINQYSKSTRRNSPSFKVSSPVRVAIPEQLRSIIGKRELKKSLRTKDNRQALLRFPAIYGYFLNVIELAKQHLLLLGVV